MLNHQKVSTYYEHDCTCHCSLLLAVKNGKKASKTKTMEPPLNAPKVRQGIPAGSIKKRERSTNISKINLSLAAVVKFDELQHKLYSETNQLKQLNSDLETLK